MSAGDGKRILKFDLSTRVKTRADSTDARPPASPSAVVQGWTSIYQLRITLRDVTPPVWRRIQVPGTIDLSALHEVINAAMGWAEETGEPEGAGEWIVRTGAGDLPPSDVDAEHRTTLEHLLHSAGDSFMYASGLGDEWIHIIEVEEIRSGVAAGARPVCLAGERACPPADSDGPAAYDDFVAALRDPFHEAHAEALESVNGRFDPERFDLEAANSRIARLFT